MNILFLCHRIPYPPNKGDKIRSFNEIKFLSKKHRIFLGTTLDETAELVYLDQLGQYCEATYAACFNRRAKLLKSVITSKPFSVSSFYDKGLQDFVNTTLANKKIDAIICFCSSMAEYVFMSSLYRERSLSGTLLIMDYVDLDSDKWLQYAAYTKAPLSWVYKSENKRLFKYEIDINQLFLYSIFVSQREVRVFEKVYQESKNIVVISNGVDYEFFSPKWTVKSREQIKLDWNRDNPETNPILVFTGVMDYFANEDGVTWFCEKIFPMIRSELPKAEFYIVGNRPTDKVWNLSEINGVTVTGFVADIREFYWIADVCVMPLRIARGLQNKVLEAMATGNAVVATSNASDGIVCHNYVDIVIEDDEEKFADVVVSLVRNQDKIIELGRKAVQNIRKNYDWDTNLEAFDALLRSK